MKQVPIMAVALAVLLVACGGASDPAGSPADTDVPTSELLATASVAPTVAAQGPASSEGELSATVEINGRTYGFDEVQRCFLTADGVDLGAGSGDGRGALLVQGDFESPEDFLINVSRVGEFAYGYALATAGGVAPRVTVDGDTIEIVADIYPGLSADSEGGQATIRATCPDAFTGTDEDAGSGDGAGSSAGSGTVEVGGQSYELIAGEVCDLGFGVQASMASDDGSASLDVFAVGGSGPITFARVADGEYWLPVGEQPAFDVAGSTATWSGRMVETYSSREETATIEISCTGSEN